MQPVYTLDTMSDATLSQLNSVTIDVSAARDGSESVVYRVSTVRIRRPPPGLSGRPNPPTITVHTVQGDKITVTNSIATVTDSAEAVLHTLSAAAAQSRRLRRRRLLAGDADDVEEVTDEVEDAMEAPVKPHVPGPHLFPLEWIPVPTGQHRALQEEDAGGSAFVRRPPSNTSFVFKLQHMGKPTTFLEHHHGLREGSLLTLPVCARSGRVHHFRLKRSNLIPKDLQKQFPHIRVYHATEEGGHMTADVTVSTAGVRSQIWHQHGNDGKTKQR